MKPRRNIEDRLRRQRLRAEERDGCVGLPRWDTTSRGGCPYKERANFDGPTSGIRNLERQAVLALLLPLLGPSFVQWALRIVGGRLRAREFDGVDTAEVADLVALCPEPNILDAG